MNNSCSTDFYNECIKDDFPYRVIWDYQPIFIERSFPMIKLKEEEEEFDRFDILDIPPQK